MSQDLTPEHMRCPMADCPSLHRLDDGRLLIVGTDGHKLSIEHGIHGSMDERAIVISPSLLDTLMEEVRSETIAQFGPIGGITLGDNLVGKITEAEAIALVNNVLVALAAAIRTRKDTSGACP